MKKLLAALVMAVLASGLAFAGGFGTATKTTDEKEGPYRVIMYTLACTQDWLSVSIPYVAGDINRVTIRPGTCSNNVDFYLTDTYGVDLFTSLGMNMTSNTASTFAPYVSFGNMTNGVREMCFVDNPTLLVTNANKGTAYVTLFIQY